MVDHKITKEYFSMPEDLFLRYELSAKDDFPNLTGYTPQLELLLKNTSSYGETPPASTKKRGGKCSCDNLSDISFELLSRSSAHYGSTSAAKEIKALGMSYEAVMETFLLKVDHFMLSVIKMRGTLVKSLQEFQTISRSMAHVILGSSITNCAAVVGSLMHRMFRFSWNPKFFFLFPTAIGALSFAASLLTFAYMKHTTALFSRDLLEESRSLKDLIAAHRKGDWLDEKVARLFPHGINMNLIDQRAMEDGNDFEKKHLWKKYLCSKIIQSNTEKDAKLLNDEEFLIRVKLFVENPAAEIWWSRMTIKKLLEDVRQKVDNMQVKEFLSSHEDVIYRTALFVYPVLIPWLTNSRSPVEMRFIFTSLAGILAALELGTDGSEELDKMKKLYLSFENDFKKIYRIREKLDAGED